MSTRDILRQAKPKVHPCEISTGTVYVRSLSGKGRVAYLAIPEEGSTRPSHKIAALGLCEEDGTLTYTNEADIAELEDIEGADLQKIVLKLFEISGLAKDATDDAEKK